MATASLHRAGAGIPLQKIDRYGYERRVTAVGWAALLIVIAVLSVWAYCRMSTGPSNLPDNEAVSPLPGSLSAWLAKSQPLIDHLVAERNNIAAAAGRRDAAATGAACQSATGAVSELHRQLPGPERVLNMTLQQAVQYYETGLPYCIAAARTEDARGMQQAATHIRHGDAFMRKALTFLDQRFGGFHGGMLLV